MQPLSSFNSKRNYKFWKRLQKTKYIDFFLFLIFDLINNI